MLNVEDIGVDQDENSKPRQQQPLADQKQPSSENAYQVGGNNNAFQAKQIQNHMQLA